MCQFCYSKKANELTAEDPRFFNVGAQHITVYIICFYIAKVAAPIYGTLIEIVVRCPFSCMYKKYYSYGIFFSGCGVLYKWNCCGGCL